MKCSVYIAASLDGFIAREDGDIDWLTEGYVADGEDYGYQAFMDSVDTLVIGRHTYEKVLAFGGWHYGAKPVVVLSSRPLELPDYLPETVEALSGSPAEVVEECARRSAKHLYIDGGQTIQRFLAAGLIDRMIITRVPILLGQGIPLFGPLKSDIRLRHVATREFSTGLVQSEYEVER